jgi:hypothetical protein
MLVVKKLRTQFVGAFSESVRVRASRNCPNYEGIELYKGIGC